MIGTASKDLLGMIQKSREFRSLYFPFNNPGEQRRFLKIDVCACFFFKKNLLEG